MGQLTNILDGRIVPSPMVARPAPHSPQPSNLARLIPGVQNGPHEKVRSHYRSWLESADFSVLGASLFASFLFPVVLRCARVDVPRSTLLLAVLLSPALTALSRKALRVVAPDRRGCRNVLAVGSGTLALHALADMWNSHTSRRSVTRVISGPEFGHLCARGVFATLAREQFLDEILILSQDVDLLAIMDEARSQRLDVTVACPTTGKSEPGKVSVERVGRAELIGIRRESLPIIQLAAKRAVDVALSSIALLALLPLLLMIAAVIAIDSEGPIIYRSQRVGLKGRKFLCYKFRTMMANAEARKEELRKRNERTGAFFKITDDPRVTRIGKLLRRYSLDELPQLWNVLRGDMSLVGPRPHPPDDLERYGTHHLRRLDFVPGITGLWQVTARQDPSFEKSVALDVEYIRNWSLWLDLRILWRTVGAVVRGSGE